MTDKRGSVILETALCFSIALVFICSVISITVFIRTDILMQRSVNQACEEVSLLPPAGIPLSDTVSTLINAFPDLGIGDTKGAGVMRKVASVVGGVDMYTGYTIEELVLEGTLAHTIANKIRGGYISRNNGSDFFVPESIDVDLNVKGEEHIIEVVCTYDTLTLAGRIRRSIYSVIPIYGRFDLLLNPSSAEEDDYDIWSEDNFTRGDFFREEQGSNMPKTFPVIDSYDNGVCSSVYSLDLTSPYYASGRLDRTVKGEIDKLADFDGADVMINKQRYVVRGSDITGRVLDIIIPSNADESDKERLRSYTSYASSRGVQMRITEYGNSRRYISEQE